MQDRHAEWTDRDAVDRRIPSVDYNDLDYDGGADRYLLGEIPFTGFSTMRYPDGKLESIASFANGLEHGLNVGWHPSGQIRLYAEIAESVYHGVAARWDQDGLLVVVEQYDLGLLVADERQGKVS